MYQSLRTITLKTESRRSRHSCPQTPHTSPCSVSPPLMMVTTLLTIPSIRPWSPQWPRVRRSWRWGGSGPPSTGSLLTSPSSSGTWGWAATRGTWCPNSATPPPSSAPWSSLNGQSKSLFYDDSVCIEFVKGGPVMSETPSCIVTVPSLSRPPSRSSGASSGWRLTTGSPGVTLAPGSHRRRAPA